MTYAPTIQRTLARITLCAFVSQSLLAAPAAQAQPLSASPGAAAGQRPLVDAAQNGVPIVDIAPPSAAGVSRNQYEQFNVGKPGLILNNSNAATQTQLGGWVNGNPQLGYTPARIILNEVVSGNPSSLQGYIEVAGRRADIVVANPNGITCDGCGFLNSARASLVTGTPQFDSDGTLNGFDVRRGSVGVGAGGLDAGNLEQLDLIARGMVLEGEVWAKNLNLVTGANRVLYATLQANAQAGSTGQPQFLIDIKDVGGMYANQIYLVANEKGLGVNSTGRIAALQGDLQLSVDGNLTLGDTYAKHAIQLASGGDTTLLGQTQSEGGTQIASAGALANRGQLDSGGALALNAKSIDNSGALIQRSAETLRVSASSGVTNSGSVYSGGGMQIDADTLADHGGNLQSLGDAALRAKRIALDGGTLNTRGNATLSATAGNVDGSGARIYADGKLAVDAAGQVANRAGSWQAGQDVMLHGAAVDNAGGAVLAGKTLVVTASGTVGNTDGQLLAGGALQIAGGALGNAGGQVVSDDTLSIVAAVADNHHGTLSAAQRMSVDAGTQLDNTRGGVLVSGSALSVKAEQLANDGGQIVAHGESADALVITATAMSNRAGVLNAGGGLSLTASGALDNRRGSIQAGSAGTQGAATVQSASLSNAGGRIVARDQLALATGALDNSADLGNAGVIASSDAGLTINAGETRNAGGVITAATQTTLDTQALDNRGGELSAGGTLTLNTHGATLDNRGGSLLSQGDQHVHAGSISNGVESLPGAQGGRIVSSQQLDLQADALDNSGGLAWVGTQANIALGAGGLANHSGRINALDTLALNATGALANQGGQLVAGKQVLAQAGTMDNAQGEISAAENVSVQSQGAFGNAGGIVSSEKTLALGASSLDNTDGALNAQDIVVALGAGTLNNAGGGIGGTQTLHVESGHLINSGGNLSTGGALTIDTQGQRLDNAGGKLLAAGAMQVDSAALDNTAGAIASTASSLSIDTHGQALDNTHGALQAAGDVTLGSGALTNASGVISGQQVTLTSAGFDNRQGTVIADAGLGISAQGIANDAGLLQAQGKVTLDAQGQALSNTRSGDDAGIVAGAALDIAAGSVDNRAGYLGSHGTQTLKVTGTLDNGALEGQGGQIIAYAGATHHANDILNAGGRIAAADALVLDATHTVDNRGGQLLSNATLGVQAGTLDNSVGGAIDGQSVSVSADQIGNQGGHVEANASTLLHADALDNSGGTLSAGTQLDANATTLNNAGGRIVGNQGVTVTTASGSVGGTIASQHDVTLNILGDYSNTGLLSAQQNLTLNANTIANSGTLTAGNTLTANAGNLSNSGEISATTTRLNLTGTLENTGSGLIDGVDTDITAQSLNNAGRIYGDALHIRSEALTNAGSGVIAARNTLQLGANTVSNTGGGLIYSLGDIAMAAGFDASGAALGVVQDVLNASSTIEARGNLAVASAHLVNRNDGLTTQIVPGASSKQVLVQPAGSTTRYPASQCFGVGGDQDKSQCIVHPELYGTHSPMPPATSTVAGYCSNPDNCEPDTTVINYGWDSPVFAQLGVTPVGAPPAQPADGCTDAGGAAVNTPECVAWTTWQTGFDQALTALDAKIAAYNAQVAEENKLDEFEDYTLYTLTTSKTETTIATTDPAKLLAGGDIKLQGVVENDNSDIVAGNAISMPAGKKVDNIAAQGTNTTTTSGTAQFTEVVSCGSWWDDKHCRVWNDAQPYAQAPGIEYVSLPGYRYVEHAADATSTRNLVVVTQGADSSQASGVASIEPVSRTLKGSAGATLALVAPKATKPFVAAPSVFVVPVSGSGTQAQDVVLSVMPQPAAPTSSLFAIHPEPGTQYLVETDPRFTNGAAFLGSDYFLSQFERDPAQQLKRYGDGFYEQSLINDQVLALTGRRYLSGYAGTEAEYKALMDAGVAYAKEYRLTPGVALSAEQMAQLSSDIVWLERASVTLADGSTQQVLLPRVYLRRPQAGDLRSSGALIAANDIDIRSTDALTNSGTLQGNRVQLVAGTDLVNDHGTVRGQQIVAQAGQDLKNLSGLIAGEGADSTVTLGAGRDLIVQTRTVDSTNAMSQRTGIDRIATVQGGNVSLQAARDLVAQGAALSASGDLALVSKGNIQLAIADSQYALNLKGGGLTLHEASATHQGTRVQAGGNLSVQAAGDVSMAGAALTAGQNAWVQGANVSVAAVKDSQSIDLRTDDRHGYTRVAQSDETFSGGSISAGNNLDLRATAGALTLNAAQLDATAGQATLAASGDVAIQALTTAHTKARDTQGQHKGLFSSSQDESHSTQTLQQVAGSAVSGKTVLVQAGAVDGRAPSGSGSITVSGSNVVADDDLVMRAGGDITLQSVAQTQSSQSANLHHQSGIFGSDSGMGVTFGSKSLAQQDKQESVSQVESRIGSLGGNISLGAGRDYTQLGSQVLAPAGDIDIHAQQIDIAAAQQSGSNEHRQEQQQSGLTLQVSSNVVAAAQQVQQLTDAASKTSNKRLQALALAAATLAATQAVAEAAQNPNASASLTVGSSQSKQKETQRYSQASASTLAAGGDLSVRATGGDTRRGDINVTGSDLSAGGNATLAAHGDLLLQSAQNTSDLHRENESSSAAVGIAASYSQKGGKAIGFTASGSLAQGKTDGSDLSQRNSHVSAGEKLTLQSDGDMALKGAVASGKQVALDAANLVIESRQDTSSFKSQDTSLSGSVTVGYGFSASASANQTKVDADYAAVAEQSGIQAGDGGFQVRIKGHTQLNGGVIASNDTAIAAHLNSFSTGTLSVTDIHNHAQYEASSIGLSGGMSVKGSGPDDGAAKGKSPAGKSGNATERAPQSNGVSLQTFDGTPSGSAGLGEDSGNANSITRSAISEGAIAITDEAAQRTLSGQGVAYTIANLNRDTTRAAGTLAPIFDADKVSAEVKAQVTITQQGGAILAKTIGDYAGDQIKKYELAPALAQRAKDTLADPGASADQKAAAQAQLEDAVATLADPAQQTAYEHWKEGGDYRVALHTALGALSGGLDGAAGAGLSAATLPAIDGRLKAAGLPEPIRQGVTAALAGTLGAAVGGGSGAMAGYNGVVNNYLNHEQAQRLADETRRCRAQAQGCSQAQLQTILERYEALSGENSQALAQCSDQSCRDTHLAEIANAAPAMSQALAEIKQAGGGGADTVLLRSMQTGIGPQERSIQTEQQRQEFLAGARTLIAQTCQGLSQDQCTAQLLSNRETAKKIALVVGLGVVTGPVAPELLAAARAGAAACASSGVMLCASEIGAFATDLVASEYTGGAALTVTAGAAAKLANEASTVGKETAGAAQLSEELLKTGSASMGAKTPGVIATTDGASVAANSAGQLATRERVLANIEATRAGNASSRFDAHLARTDQIRWGYAPDNWSMTTLNAGDRVFGGLPGQSSYYTSAATLEASGGSRATLFQSLQVKPHPEFGYRPKVGEYEVIRPTTVPTGVTSANPGLGAGNGEQFFIRNYQNSLKLIREVPLGQ